jgi:hypothetical protein
MDAGISQRARIDRLLVRLAAFTTVNVAPAYPLREWQKLLRDVLCLNAISFMFYVS